MESFNGSAAVLALTTPVLSGPTRTVTLSVSLASRPTAAAAVAAYSLVAPPAVVSAAFTAALTAILVVFDGPTNKCVPAGCGDTCSCLLDAASAARLAGIGRRASCVWAPDGASLSLLLGAGATVAPGDSLHFATCLAGSGEPSGAPGAAPVALTVAAPALPAAPVVTLTGPGAIDSCSSLELAAAAYRYDIQDPQTIN